MFLKWELSYLSPFADWFLVDEQCVGCMGFPEGLKRASISLAPFSITKTQAQAYSSDVAGRVVAT